MQRHLDWHYSDGNEMQSLNFLPAFEIEQIYRKQRAQWTMLAFFVVLVSALILSGFDARADIAWEKRLQTQLGMDASVDASQQKQTQAFNQFQKKFNAAHRNQDNILKMLSLLANSVALKIKIQKLNIEPASWQIEGSVSDQKAVSIFLEKLRTQFPNANWQINELSQSEKTQAGFAFSLAGSTGQNPLRSLPKITFSTRRVSGG